MGGFAAGERKRARKGRKRGWRDVPSQAGRFDRGRGELLLGHATRAGTRRSAGGCGDWCRMLRHDGVCWVLGVHEKTVTAVGDRRIGVDRDHSFGVCSWSQIEADAGQVGR